MREGSKPNVRGLVPRESAVCAAHETNGFGAGLEGLHALIVDDEENSAYALAALLEYEGMHTIAETNADHALERCAGKPLHVALLDGVMPGVSGLVLLQRLRTLHPELPVVLISGYVSSHPGIAEALELPAVVYMAKPIDLQELGRVIVRLTGRLQAH